MNRTKNNKNTLMSAFTIVEVSILFVIFLIVTFLVAPLSLNETIQANNASKWRDVQGDFTNIYDSINSEKDNQNFDFATAFESVLAGEVVGDIEPYKITNMNGTFPSAEFRFSNFKQTSSRNATVAYKLYTSPQSDVLGILMYDVNGSSGPNVWGKDVYGYYIHSDRFEPFCQSESVVRQKQDCSKSGTGLCCSSSYLVPGSFN